MHTVQYHPGRLGKHQCLFQRKLWQTIIMCLNNRSMLQCFMSASTGWSRFWAYIDINIHNLYMCVCVRLSLYIYSVQCGMLLFYYMNLYDINWYYMNVCNHICIGWALQNPFPASDRVHLRLSKALWQPLNLLQQSRSRKFSSYIHDTEHFWYVQQIWRWSFATLDTLGQDLLLGP
jgi:hypothetical protein